MDPRQDEVNRLRDDASSDEIRRGIQQTRREMDETVDEIGNRLHPRHLLDDVIDILRSKFSSDGANRVGERVSEAARQTGKTLGRQVRENPLPTLLVGAGLVWWLVDASREDEDDYEGELSRSDRPDYSPSESALVISKEMAAAGPEGSKPFGEQKPGFGTKAREKAREAGDKLSEAGSRIAHAGHTAKQKLGAAGQAAADRISEAGPAAAEKWRSARQKGRRAYDEGSRLSRRLGTEVRDAWDETQRGARLAQRKAGEVVDDYPFAVGAAALAAGMLVGALTPRTRCEHELMGEASEDAISRARHVGLEALERAETVAARTATSALEEAEEQGLTPEAVGEKLGNFVSHVGQAAKEAAEEEEMQPSQLREKIARVAEEAGETAQREGKQAASGLSESRRTT